MGLKVEGKIYGFSKNKKGVVTLRIKTMGLFQSDIDKIGQSEQPPTVIIEIINIYR